MEYTFTLKYQFSIDADATDRLIEKLAEAGREDALIGSRRPGRLALEFTREVGSAMAAVQSAMNDIQKATQDARLVEATPDFVGLTNIAEILGVRRQAVRKLMLSHQRSFTLLVHESSIAIWHLDEVLVWFERRGSYETQASLKETAYTLRALNAARPQFAA